MDINVINLGSLRRPLEDALNNYASITGLRFQDFPDLTLTPEKPNSARTVIPVTYDSVRIGDFYAIVFVRGDGTGDSKTFKLDNLTISPDYVHNEKPERVIPRAKTGIISEGFFPLFSLTPKNEVVMFASSLDELSVFDGELGLLWKLGQDNSDYSRSIRNGVAQEAQVYFTVGNYPGGKRIGDPHSIYYTRDTEDALQVVGFLGIPNDSAVPIDRVTKSWRFPRR